MVSVSGANVQLFAAERSMTTREIRNLSIFILVKVKEF